MRIYLAARFSEKNRMKHIREYLEGCGHQVTSNWLDEKEAPSITLDQVSDEFKIAMAIQGIEDIKSAQVVILFTIDPKEMSPRGGRHFESGYAYGIAKRLWIVGPKENIFHSLPEVLQFDDIFAAADALDVLEKITCEEQFAMGDYKCNLEGCHACS